MYNIVKRSKIIFFMSVAIVVASIATVSVFGLKLGLDFTGGTLEEISFDNRPELSEASAVLSEVGVKNASVQFSGDRNILIRSNEISSEQHDQLLAKMKEKFGNLKEERFETVGPTIGEELKRKTYLAVAAAVLAILGYIAYAFRKVTRPPSWVYGGAAVIALFHDLAITIAVFSLLGRFQGVEIDTLFVTALLTTLGYSVNDTIVVFDRIRERTLRSNAQPFEELVNKSINETVVRSLNTSLTTILVLLALLFFGGESIRYFVMALIVGVTAGTYSSIFVASPILVFWHNRRAGKHKPAKNR